MKYMIKKFDNSIFIVLLVLITIFNLSCKKEKPITNGKIIFKFSHNINGQTIIRDSMMYVNAAGNPFMVQELRYFISDITFHYHDGYKKTINDKNNICYIDLDIPASLTWNIADNISGGTYDSISFTFGLTKIKNITNFFVNPPESNMAWPISLGGGYHYMQMNGEWKNPPYDTIYNFNCHLGIGQVMSSMDTVFVQNYFTVNLPNSSFVLTDKQTKEIQIVMNIENWFKGVNTINFYETFWPYNSFMGGIMMNQNAMQKISANGKNVFSVGYIK